MQRKRERSGLSIGPDELFPLEYGDRIPSPKALVLNKRQDDGLCPEL
jgi:hypothetical protein